VVVKDEEVDVIVRVAGVVGEGDVVLLLVLEAMVLVVLG